MSGSKLAFLNILPFCHIASLHQAALPTVEDEGVGGMCPRDVRTIPGGLWVPCP